MREVRDMWDGVGAGEQGDLYGGGVDNVADLVDEDDVGWQGAGVLGYRFERGFGDGGGEIERRGGCEGAGREGDCGTACHEGGFVDDACLCHRRWAGAVLSWSRGKPNIVVGRCGRTALDGRRAGA